MKSKELIKLLQEADPEGESHVRLEGDGDGGIPLYVELKEGYWDGSYEYLDEEGNFVTSTEGCKKDL